MTDRTVNDDVTYHNATSERANDGIRYCPYLRSQNWQLVQTHQT